MSSKSAKALKELRKAMNGISQEQLANEIGTTSRTISRYESGSEPTGANLSNLIAAAENVGRTDLMNFFSEMKQKAISESVKSLLSPGSARRIPLAELKDIRDAVQLVLDKITNLENKANAQEISEIKLKLAYVDDWLNAWTSTTGSIKSKGR